MTDKTNVLVANKFLVPKVLLIALAVWGFVTLWVFPYRNGLLKILADENKPGALIPGPTAAPMKQKYTRIGPVDKQLTVLVSFFYTAIDGNRGDVSLAGLDLGGQVLAAWVMITFESLRNGNKGKWLITATTITGLAVAIVGFAVVAPLWFAIQLWTSPTVSNPRDYQLFVNLPIRLALVPFSIFCGFIFPTIIMCLPAPTMISFGTKQTWTAIQQGWPLWIAVVQSSLSTTILSTQPSTTGLTEAAKKTETIKYMRLAYLFALISSSSGHLISWGLSLLAYAFPVLFTPMYLKQFQPGNIFVPVNPLGSLKANTLADGALWFLQWDEIVGSTATLLWAVTLRSAAKQSTATFSQQIIDLIGVAIVAFIVGPCGAAVVALWVRDEMVFHRATSPTTSAKKGRTD